MKEEDDQTLIKRAQDGKQTAFDALLRRYRKDVERTAMRYLGGDFEDALQDAFLEAYLKLATLRDPGRFAQWLNAIVRNRCLAILRRPAHLSYDETASNGEVQVQESHLTPPPDRLLIQRERDEAVRRAVAKLSRHNRLVTDLHYLQEKSYRDIARELKISISTIEGRLYRARIQMREELLEMADIDEAALQSAIERATQGLQKDLDGLKDQVRAIQNEDDRWIQEARSAAGRAMTQLPTAALNPITWGIVGGYRLAGHTDSRRIASWTRESIDDYVALATDTEITRFAALFSDPVAVGLLREMVYGAQKADALTKEGRPPEAVERALAHLESHGLVQRRPDGRVEAVRDTVTYLLTLVGMAALYRGQTGEAQWGDDASRAVMEHVAQDLARGTAHPPPDDTFAHLSDVARTITLFQALPLSFDGPTLAEFKAGEKIRVQDLNAAQQEFVRILVERFDEVPADPSSIRIWLEPGDRHDDNHGHIVLEADDGAYTNRIDAFLEGTARPGWY